MHFYKIRHLIVRLFTFTLSSEKMFIPLVWKDWQSYLYHFHIIILPILFYVCQNSIHCFILKLQYNHALNDKEITFKTNDFMKHNTPNNYFTCLLAICSVSTLSYSESVVSKIFQVGTGCSVISLLNHEASIISLLKSL